MSFLILLCTVFWMKLLSYLQTYHHYPRRQCIKWIQQGLIAYQGQTVESFSQAIEQGKSLSITGILTIASIEIVPQDSQIFPRYKPKWYVVSKFDPHNPTIYEILPSQYRDRYYIGRLDKESHGLVLMTNDPAWVDHYEHPAHGHHKVYRVQVDRAPTTALVRQLCQPNRVRSVDRQGYEILRCDQVQYHRMHAEHILIITLHEGKKRHLRRLLAHCNLDVVDLCRIACGSYRLSDIRPDIYPGRSVDWYAW